MAADWIKVIKSTPDKPEVWAIAGALDLDPDAVVGKLFRVWAWFDEHTENGNAPSVTRALLDREVSVPGFCSEMEKAGWMDFDGDTVRLPNFDRHNGESAKKRGLAAERKRKFRGKSHVNGTEMERDERSESVTREEKRRNKNICPSADADERKPRVPFSEIVDLFHSCCPSLPRVVKLTPARKQQIAARWRNELRDLEDWRDYFERVEESDFLTGRLPPTGGRSKSFVADLDFLVKQGNLVKFAEGKYS